MMTTTSLKDSILSNIDYILVVNKDFEVVYSSRYDRKVIGGEERKQFIGKSLFDLFPTLNRNNSSIVKTMSTGEVIINDSQQFADDDGNVNVTQNITFPVFKEGQIAGVIELSKDITTADHVKNKKKYLRNLAMTSNFKANRDNNDRISFDDILTLDEEMLRTIEQAKVFSTHMTPTLIYGETGTGKELFAQAMINYSANPKQKIVVQNCAAVPENLLESILFGTTKGSYTGAENKKGLFEEADGGIFFLDELNALPYGVQGKLLRVVQDGTFRPIGSSKEKKVNVKIIAAMNIDPMVAIETNVLRKDLFYRLSSSMVYLPPLRERKNDIEYLTDHYIDIFNQMYHKDVYGISDELRESFLSYSWEGNVRELKHVIESMVSMAKDHILTEDQIPLYLHKKMKEERIPAGADAPKEKSVKAGAEEEQRIPEIPIDENGDLKSALEAVEKRMILSTLKKVNGNKTKAGKLLGIPRQTLKYKMDKWGIDDKE